MYALPHSGERKSQEVLDTVTSSRSERELLLGSNYHVIKEFFEFLGGELLYQILWDGASEIGNTDQDGLSSNHYGRISLIEDWLKLESGEHC